MWDSWIFVVHDSIAVSIAFYIPSLSLLPQPCAYCIFHLDSRRRSFESCAFIFPPTFPCWGLDGISRYDCFESRTSSSTNPNSCSHTPPHPLATHFDFIREIPIWAKYEVRITIGAWDHKWVRANILSSTNHHSPHIFSRSST
jgi:hypothetical protein